MVYYKYKHIGSIYCNHKKYKTNLKKYTKAELIKKLNSKIDSKIETNKNTIIFQFKNYLSQI